MKKRSITYTAYLDKVYAGWLGKSIGGTIGLPFESHKIFGDIKAEDCWPETIYPNDDLDIQMVWLEMLEELGTDFTQVDLARYWQDRCWYNFCEYGNFLYNVQRGIHPPLSGRFNNLWFSESMGCPIRAEIWGMVSPGNADLAAHFARMDGELDHIDNSVWAEQFWAAVIAEAFFTEDLAEAVAEGRKVIPPDSRICSISYDIPELWSAYGDWKIVWKEIIRKYGHRDVTNVALNFAFTMLALYAGEGNFKETIVIAINSGWDADCTAATAGAVLGVLKGTGGLPYDWKEKLGDRLCCDVAVRRKEALIYDCAADTCSVGLEAMLTSNPLLDITEVPMGILCEVEKRKNGRSGKPDIRIESSYPDGPVLYRDRSAQAILKIHYSGAESCKGSLTISGPEGIIVFPAGVDLLLSPGYTQEVLMNIRRDGRTDVIWDKNLFEASLKCENGKAVNHVFGLAGSRQWQVYGPYWDAWDTTMVEICPFRNSERIVNPGLVPIEKCGNFDSHQFIRLDREYLDENRLKKESIPEERPFIVECGEDYLEGRDLGGFFGEACYYLVREIVADTPVECTVTFGAAGPFIVWMDGEEVLRNDKHITWSKYDFHFSAIFDKKPRRLVIKCLKTSDDFRFSIWYMKTNVAGDKTMGISYMLDCMGDAVSTP